MIGEIRARLVYVWSTSLMLDKFHQNRTAEVASLKRQLAWASLELVACGGNNITSNGCAMHAIAA